ncbi:FtsX-like permease family protein [Promicromonospora sp. NPDC050249]|uniref:FtsX-like permease family protein n=1 Tax=Promicromonospora sp. NPDC050249 TaxID=3154743 RepID=UPI0033E5B769
MFRLLTRDLVFNARIWLGLAMVAAAGAASVAVSASTADAAYRATGNTALALYGISGSLLVFTSVAAVVVLSSVAGLTVALHERDYALWQLVGFGPGAIRTVVLAQLAAVGLVGALAGCLAAAPLLQPFADYVFAGSSGLGRVQLRLGAVGTFASVFVVVLLLLAGGSRAARRAGRVTGLELLREAAVPRLRMTWSRWVLSAGLLTVVTSMALGLFGRDVADLETSLSLIPPMVAGLFVAGSPLVTAPLTRAWTGLVPARASVAWYLARNVAFAALDRSTAAINPLVVTIALTGGLYTAHGMVASVEAAQTGAPATGLPAQFVVLLLGGPLLLAAVGAAATVAMSGRARTRDAALLEAAGSTPGTVVASAALEAVIQVGTAALLGVAAVTCGALAGASALGWQTLGAATTGISAVVVTGAGGLLLVLAATVIPAVVRLRQDPVRVLATE